jgi:hypothetical protein
MLEPPLLTRQVEQGIDRRIRVEIRVGWIGTVFTVHALGKACDMGSGHACQSQGCNNGRESGHVWTESSKRDTSQVEDLNGRSAIETQFRQR